MHIRVAIEGADGTGKTSITKLVTESILKKFKGYEIIVMREPGGTTIGEMIRSKILFPADGKKVHDSTFRIAFMLSHSDLVNKLRTFETTFPNTITILDRYSPTSNFVYERYGCETDASWMMGVYKKLQQIWQPDIIITLCPCDERTEDVLIERSRVDRANSNHLDAQADAIHKKRIEGYRAISKSATVHKNIRPIYFSEKDAVEDVAEKVFKMIVKFYEEV